MPAPQFFKVCCEQVMVMQLFDDGNVMRIVLLTTQKDADRSAMQRQAKASGASELAVPAVIQVVDKLPLLGSGKMDYVAAAALAAELPKGPELEVA